MQYYDIFGFKLTVISGLAHDKNFDGLKDVNTSPAPSHFFRVLFSCSSEWNPDGSCREEDKIEVFSFIFPLIEKDKNDLTAEALFLQYSARLKDVELISGF